MQTPSLRTLNKL